MVGVAARDGADDAGEMLRPAIVQIIAVNRGNDGMRQPHAGDGIGHPFGFVGFEGSGQAGLHIAEGAGPGAGVAHDHEGGVLLRPAFADIGAARLLADGDQTVVADDLLGFRIDRRTRRLHPDPLRLAQERRIGLVGLFRVAEPCIEECCHWLASGPEGAVDQDQDAGAGNGDDQLPSKPPRPMPKASSSCRQRTDDAEHDVHDEARIEVHHLFSDPAGKPPRMIVMIQPNLPFCPLSGRATS